MGFVISPYEEESQMESRGGRDRLFHYVQSIGPASVCGGMSVDGISSVQQPTTQESCLFPPSFLGRRYVRLLVNGPPRTIEPAMGTSRILEKLSDPFQAQLQLLFVSSWVSVSHEL